MQTRTELPEIRRRRGISAAHLARSAGVSRQTIYAMEAGDYVPNTALALALARILEVRVEDLFQLEGEAPVPAKPVSAEVLNPGEPLRKGQPVQLCEVGKRLIAIPAEPQQPVLPLADGVLIEPVRRTGPAGVRAFPPDGSENKRLVVAGCDPGIALLAQHLSRTAGVELIVASSSSRQSLEWLKQGFVHIAGSHLRDASTGDYNLAAVRKLFPRGGVRVVTFAIWEQGLVFAPGNPKNIRSVADLAREDIRIVNRETGAGSRDLLDRELHRAGTTAKHVLGYERVAHGHLPAALAVSLGEADCCIATRSAAQAFGLGFVPLATERYDLVIRRPFVKLPAVEALLDGLNRSAIRRRLEMLAGYDTSRTGEVRVG
ncbi:MAG TPA: substrate-binding domain-containing protein [Bryobacteraceae bacterium]|nr:substrate-binding domain-containing protein [Bryobacteraceae bacterium]